MKLKRNIFIGTFVCLVCFAVLSTHAQSPGAVSLTTQDGMIIKGRIMSQTDEEVTLESALGLLTVKMSQLSPGSAALLKPVLPNDPIILKQRIAQLEKIITDLRAENQQLRIGLSATPAPVSVASPELSRGGSSSDSAATTGYWMSSTGKRHNSNCRYYGVGNGHQCGKDEGVACKICGG